MDYETHENNVEKVMVISEKLKNVPLVRMEISSKVESIENVLNNLFNIYKKAFADVIKDVEKEGYTPDFQNEYIALQIRRNILWGNKKWSNYNLKLVIELRFELKVLLIPLLNGNPNKEFPSVTIYSEELYYKKRR